MADSLRIGRDLHAGLDLARTRGNEHARTLHFDDANATDVDGRKRLEGAQGGRVDVQLPASVEDGHPFHHLDFLAVDAHLEHPPWHPYENRTSHRAPSAGSRRTGSRSL